MTPQPIISPRATIEGILALCGDMPDKAAHRHYLEQLPALQLQQRLEDLRASERHHDNAWLEQPVRNRLPNLEPTA